MRRFLAIYLRHRVGCRGRWLFGGLVLWNGMEI